jgi:hypothetical protein
MIRSLASALLFALSLATSLPARADVVFEEVVTQTGASPTGSPENITRYFISGERYRAQRKMSIAGGDYQQSMQMATQMSGTNMAIMNAMDQAGRPDYPDHLMSFDEWLGYPENSALVDQAASTGGGGRLANFMAELRGRNLSRERREAVERIVAKYSSEIDAGVIAAAKRRMAERLSSGAATQSQAMSEAVLAALGLDYEQFVRLRVVRDACAAFDPGTVSGGGRDAAAGTGANWVWGPTDFDDIRGVSDRSSPLFAQAMTAYRQDPELSAQYQGLREMRDEAPHMLDTTLARATSLVEENLADMMTNVLILRLDREKVYDVFPPQKRPGETTPRASDITYTEKSLEVLRAEYARNQGRIDAARQQAAAQMAAVEAQFGNVQAQLVSTDTVQGFSCEHWKIAAMGGSQEFWVTTAFPNSTEIQEFDAALKSRAGFDRSGLALAGAGGMGDVAAMSTSAGLSAKVKAEIDRIQARGFVIRTVTTMPGGAPTQAAMLQNHQAAGAAGADVAAQYAAQARAAQAAGTMPRPGTPEYAAWMTQMSQGMGTSMQGSVQAGVASGAYSTETAKEMTTTREIRFLRTDPIPDAAFDVPAGATRKETR